MRGPMATRRASGAHYGFHYNGSGGGGSCSVGFYFQYARVAKSADAKDLKTFRRHGDVLIWICIYLYYQLIGKTGNKPGKPIYAQGGHKNGHAALG